MFTVVHCDVGANLIYSDSAMEHRYVHMQVDTNGNGSRGVWGGLSAGGHMQKNACTFCSLTSFSTFSYQPPSAPFFACHCQANLI